VSGDGWNSMPGQPRSCAGCGKRVKLAEAWLRTGPGPRETWHATCRLAAARRSRIEAAIGETAADYDRAEHAQLVLDMIDGRGALPTERAAPAPLKSKSPQGARTG